MIAHIIAGGIIGTLARYLIGGWIQQKTGSTFPYQTLAINISGSLLIGFIFRLATGTTALSPEWRAALTIGFCGAYTTMSTFSLESVQLLRDGEFFLTALYGAATVFGCYLATFTGMMLASTLI